MLDVYFEKLEFMKSVVEQAELNGLVDANFEPDHLYLKLKNKEMKIWYKSEKIEFC